MAVVNGSGRLPFDVGDGKVTAEVAPNGDVVAIHVVYEGSCSADCPMGYVSGRTVGTCASGGPTSWMEGICGGSKCQREDEKSTHLEDFGRSP